MENNIPAQLAALIDSKLKKLRWYFLINNVVKFLPLLAVATYFVFNCFSSILSDENQSYTFSVLFVCLVIFLRFLLLKRSKAFTDISRDNYLAHCNRHFASLEESAHLALKNTNDLNLLQSFQQRKVSQQLLALLTDDSTKDRSIQYSLNGRFHRLSSLIITLFICVSLWFFSPISAIEKMARFGEHSQNKTSTSSLGSKEAVKKDVLFINSQVTVLPPKYTNLPSSVQNDLNVELLAGSEITWQLRFSDNNQRYFIEFANGETKQILLTGQNQFIYTATIEHTGLYKLYSEDKSFEQIHTLQVSLDKKPIIRILSPKSTVTEVEKEGETKVVSQVSISDDYDISHVEILASIAKGSGEAVKFRDQVFAFDSVNQQALIGDNQYQAVYEKVWDFTALNMEPGDELYFTVKAWDNKQPSTQLSSSETKIIRWLEDEDQLVMADGILIDFMPEYFKSQRQIIIETKELIADKDRLSIDDFVETSELLGVAQSELKQKYGQYLGDEFDEGGAGPVPHDAGIGAGEDESGAGHHNEHEADSHHDENHQLAKSVAASGHDHGVAGQTELEHSSDDKSGYSQLIETYAHNHEDTDIGMMSREDPKALMKQSIANMWQAELYLMLSKPKQALPFEEQALKLLKMAKKAERIYVKRLGFEPPPVSEQRRYQGDLSEILSESKQANIEIPASEQQSIAQLYRLIDQKSHQFSGSEISSVNKTDVFSSEQRLVINSVKQLLQNKLVERPVLISDIATLERILLADSLRLKDCDNCVEKLKNKLWQLLDKPIALPNVRQAIYLYNDTLINQYNELLLKSSPSKMSDKAKKVKGIN